MAKQMWAVRSHLVHSQSQYIVVDYEWIRGFTKVNAKVAVTPYTVICTLGTPTLHCRTKSNLPGSKGHPLCARKNDTHIGMKHGPN